MANIYSDASIKKKKINKKIINDEILLEKQNMALKNVTVVTDYCSAPIPLKLS